MKIEIFEKRLGGEVVETVEVSDMKAFRSYWNNQCDRINYGFRVKDGDAPEYRHWVRREPNEHGSRQAETVELTDDVIVQIAAGNEAMSPEQVRASLMHGRTIYTSFSKYTLES